jgi:hypothetical protein
MQILIFYWLSYILTHLISCYQYYTSEIKLINIYGYPSNTSQTKVNEYYTKLKPNIIYISLIHSISAIYFTLIALYKDYQNGVGLLDVHQSTLDHHKDVYDHSIIYFLMDMINVIITAPVETIIRFMFSHLISLTPITLSRYHEILGIDVLLFVLINEIGNLFMNLRSLCPVKYKKYLYLLIFSTFFIGRYLILLPYMYYHKDRFEDVKSYIYAFISLFVFGNTYLLIDMLKTLINDWNLNKIEEEKLNAEIVNETAMLSFFKCQ